MGPVWAIAGGGYIWEGVEGVRRVTFRTPQDGHLIASRPVNPVPGTHAGIYTIGPCTLSLPVLLCRRQPVTWPT